VEKETCGPRRCCTALEQFVGVHPDASGTSTSIGADDHPVPIHDRLSITSQHETGASNAMNTGQLLSNCPCGAFLHSGEGPHTSPHPPQRPFSLVRHHAKLNHPGTVTMQPLLLPLNGGNAASSKPRRALAAPTSPKQAIVWRLKVEEARIDPGGLTSAISTMGRARRKGLRRQGNKCGP
jgi:hypothetical protein